MEENILKHNGTDLPSNVSQVDSNAKWKCCKCGWIGKHSESVNKTPVVGDAWLLVCPKCGNKDEFFSYTEIQKKEDSIPFLIEFDGRVKTCIITDRMRTVNYNGDDLQMNTYSCSSCKEDYTFEQRNHKFCPFCGDEYKYLTDVSI